MYGLETTVPPKGQPVSLRMLKEHLEIPSADTTRDWYLLNALLPAATRRAEADTGRGLITQTWRMTLDCFPANRQPILLPGGKVQSVDQIIYRQTDNSWSSPTTAILTELSSAREPAELRMALQADWPTIGTQRPGVDVTFNVGYGDAADDVPIDLRVAICIVCAHYFNNREEVVVGTIVTEIPLSASRIFQQYQIGDEFTNYAA